MTKDVISKKSIQVKCCSDEDLVIVFVLEKHFRIMLTSVRLLTGICESVCLFVPLQDVHSGLCSLEKAQRRRQHYVTLL